MNGYQPRKRQKILSGNTHKVTSGCGNIYVTINRDEDGIFEIFAHLGKSGQCGASQLEAICRAVTAGLRAGVDPGVFAKQFFGIKCPSPMLNQGERIESCADAIAKVLQKEIDDINSKGEKHEG